jgi:arylsulfatase
LNWEYDGQGLGKGGTGTLKVDGNVVDSHPITVGGPCKYAFY